MEQWAWAFPILGGLLILLAGAHLRRLNQRIDGHGKEIREDLKRDVSKHGERIKVLEEEQRHRRQLLEAIISSLSKIEQTLNTTARDLATRTEHVDKSVRDLENLIARHLGSYEQWKEIVDGQLDQMKT